MNILNSIQQKGLWSERQSLRLHLGSGARRLDGYINIDYPLSEHTVHTEQIADIFADITKLDFPHQSVDEVRSHHVFEHFDRSMALAQIIKWHEWLKIGGKLHIETPDILGCSKSIVSDMPYKMKQAILRHAFGSHEAAWAYHYDGWYDDKFQDVLSRLGFDVSCRNWKWDKPPYLPNVEAIATKNAHFSRDKLLAAADDILHDSMVADVPSEQKMHGIWRESLRKALKDSSPYAVNTPIDSTKDQTTTKNSSCMDLTEQSSVTVILFSKDRPLQLDATIRSFFLHCIDIWNIRFKILFTTSNEFLHSLYQRLMNEFPSVEFISEHNFKEDLLTLVSDSGYILFLVDDNIFIKTFCLSEIHDSLNKNPDALGFSLQLGKNTNYCYPLDKEQRLPAFLEVGNGILKYDWTKSELGFNYPLEVSSSAYRTSDILPLLKQLDFHNPNSLESQLASNKHVLSTLHPFQLCYEQSVTFCAPVNMVQNVWPNRSGTREDYSTENLAKVFHDGYRIDISAYSSTIPKACHQEIELKLKKNI